MTSHQDNAARLARIAQISAVVVVLLAVAAFIVPFAARDVSPTVRKDPTIGGPTEIRVPRFEVPQEDWTLALGPLSASRDELIASNQGPGAGIDRFRNPEDDPEFVKPEPSDRRRPPIQYLGALNDDRGPAALIDFAGRQRLLRAGQAFEEDYEITRIARDLIVVSDGFDEFTFELAHSTLTDAAPNPIIDSRNRNRTNPNAFPPGRTPPGQQDPDDRGVTPRQPGAPQNDDEGGKGSPA